jgi:hypothetical protein
MEAEDIKNWIKESGGTVPRGNAGHATLVKAADDLNAEMKRKSEQAAAVNDVLTACQEAAVKLNQTRPTSVFSTSDPFARELALAANEAAEAVVGGTTGRS